MNGPGAVGRQTRVLRILARLQSGAGLNAAQLAQQMDVCRRTIYRDLNLMRDAGVAVHFDEELNCYHLPPRTDLVVAPTFNGEELTMLVSAIHLSMLNGLPHFNQCLQQTTKKLLAQSSMPIRHSISRLVHACTVRPPTDANPARTMQVVQCVLQAIRQRRVLLVTLVQPCGETVQTKLSPYQMIATPEALEIVGRSTHHRAVKSFDPRDFLNVQVVDQSYAIPRGYRVR